MPFEPPIIRKDGQLVTPTTRKSALQIACILTFDKVEEPADLKMTMLYVNGINTPAMEELFNFFKGTRWIRK